MAETKEFRFDLKEAAIALVKLHGIHEGLWQIGFEFSLGAGNMGPSVEATRPSAFVQINRLILSRHDVGTPIFPYVVDAAEVNPAGGPQRATKGRKSETKAEGGRLPKQRRKKTRGIPFFSIRKTALL